MELSHSFQKNIENSYGEAGSKWLASLPGLIKSLEERAQFTFLQPMPELFYHFVGTVQNKTTKQNFVLKMGPSKEKLKREVDCLQNFSFGVPKIFHYFENENAYLMDQLKPGTRLKELAQNNDQECSIIVAKLILNLQKNQKSIRREQFPHLSKLNEDTKLLENKIDLILFSKWKSLLADLTIPTQTDILLHGDLHHSNILKHGDAWMAIDPHGLNGDPIYESAAMIYNPLEMWNGLSGNAAKIIESRIRILSKTLLADPKKIKSWAFCKTLLVAAWHLEDHGELNNSLIQLAKVIDQLNLD